MMSIEDRTKEYRSKIAELSGQIWPSSDAKSDIELEVVYGEAADKILSITRAAFAEYEGKLNPPSGAANSTLEEISSQIAEGGAVLATLDNNPVGSALFRLRPDHLYIGRLSVLPGYRGRGVASAVLRLCEQIAMNVGLKELRLGTRVSMPRNIALYERHGYVITGYVKHPGGDGTDTIVHMTKRLN